MRRWGGIPYKGGRRGGPCLHKFSVWFILAFFGVAVVGSRLKKRALSRLGKPFFFASLCQVLLRGSRGAAVLVNTPIERLRPWALGDDRVLHKERNI